jgi:hypothetical protein
MRNLGSALAVPLKCFRRCHFRIDSRSSALLASGRAR